jgi:hypothetical protein
MVRRYHDTMTKNLTIRLPDEVAADAEALARVEGTSLNEMVKQALIEAVERRRNDPKFRARLAKVIEEDRQLLERLAIQPRRTRPAPRVKSRGSVSDLVGEQRR